LSAGAPAITLEANAYDFIEETSAWRPGEAHAGHAKQWTFHVEDPRFRF
jgi:hypothetical protein